MELDFSSSTCYLRIESKVPNRLSIEASFKNSEAPNGRSWLMNEQISSLSSKMRIFVEVRRAE